MFFNQMEEDLGIMNFWVYTFNNGYGYVIQANRKQPFIRILKISSSEHPCGSVISMKLPCNIIKITLQHGCFPVNLLHIFKTRFPKNTYGGLHLRLLIKIFNFSYQSHRHQEKNFWTFVKLKFLLINSFMTEIPII